MRLAFRRQAQWPFPPGAGPDQYLPKHSEFFAPSGARCPAGKKHESALKTCSSSPTTNCRGSGPRLSPIPPPDDAYSVRGWYHTLYADVFRGKKVLEIGSGLGFDGITFAAQGADWTFVDIVETNLEVVRRLCKLKGISNVRFCYLEDLRSLGTLPSDYAAIYAQGSLIDMPIEATRVEAQALLQHLPVGGRWIELAYPRRRWIHDGRMPFDNGERKPTVGRPGWSGTISRRFASSWLPHDSMSFSAWTFTSTISTGLT